MKVLSGHATGRTLAEMLNAGTHRHVLLKFFHGLGDAVSFYYNVLPVLRKKFPGVDFAFLTHLGQETLFGEADPNPSHYDLAVELEYLCAEWDDSPETKAEKCLREEIGLAGVQCDSYFPPETGSSPLIGVHFHSTCCAGLCAGHEDAELLWRKIEDRGLIPLDTHINHRRGIDEEVPFPFAAGRNLAEVKPDARTLTRLLRGLGGFAGVPSGNFWLALTVLPPRRILCIEREFPVRKLTRLPVHHVRDMRDPAVDLWLDCISK